MNFIKGYGIVFYRWISWEKQSKSCITLNLSWMIFQSGALWAIWKKVVSCLTAIRSGGLNVFWISSFFAVPLAHVSSFYYYSSGYSGLVHCWQVTLFFHLLPVYRAGQITNSWHFWAIDSYHFYHSVTSRQTCWVDWFFFLIYLNSFRRKIRERNSLLCIDLPKENLSFDVLSQCNWSLKSGGWWENLFL